MHTLVDAFNPSTAQNVMCTNTLSVSWEGYLYDCDFNQMLAIKLKEGKTTLVTLILDTLQKERFSFLNIAMAVPQVREVAVRVVLHKSL